MYVLCGRKVSSRITVSSIHLKCLTSLCIRDETLIIFILDSEVVFRPAFLTISSPHIPSPINIYAIYVCVCTKDSAFCLLRVYNGYVCLFVCYIFFLSFVVVIFVLSVCSHSDSSNILSCMKPPGTLHINDIHSRNLREFWSAHSNMEWNGLAKFSDWHGPNQC